MKHFSFSPATFVVIALFTTVFFTALPTAQAETSSGEIKTASPNVGKETSVILKDNDYKFRLKTERKKGIVQVYSLGPNHELPDELNLQLHHGEGTVQNITLKAINPNLATDAHHPPTFAGKLDASAGSIIGIELRFGLSSSAPARSIKWKELDGPIEVSTH